MGLVYIFLHERNVTMAFAAYATHKTNYGIKVLYEQTRELTHDFLDYV